MSARGYAIWDWNRYAQAFRENQVDAQFLPKLTAEDLNPDFPYQLMFW
jgi:hypothetical protein